jgi:hypothetical protein
LNAKVLLLSFAVLLTVGVPLAAQDQLKLEDRVVLTKASPGCVRREEFDTLIEIAQQRDEVAFAQYMRSHKCPVLEIGTIGIYEDGVSRVGLCVFVVRGRRIAYGYQAPQRKRRTNASSRLHHHQRDCRQDNADRHQREQRPGNDCTIHGWPRVSVEEG